MKKMFFIFAALGLTAFAQAKSPNYFLKISGAGALKDHHINQYDDVTDPYQAYLITLPEGLSLRASDIESGGDSVCSVTGIDLKKRTIKIESLYIETDAATCIVTLTIDSSKEKKDIKVKYSIEQTGT